MSSDDEPADRPRKKKKKKRPQKSNAPLVIGIIVGILLLAGGIVTVAMLMRKKDDTQTKGPPPPPPVIPKEPPKFEPKPKKGKDLISAVARRMEVSEVNNWFRQLGLAYHTVSTETISGAGPRDFAQLGREFANTPLKEWHDKQWVVVVWNVRLPNVQQKSSTALAWETDADGQGNRIVLMCDGSVQSLDEATFAKTAKAMGK
ncbi:MAG: hypothetical protein FJ271_13680 [Planctomycetes bacterium]|nr:hypothetical protein [Planctomycetota bacterium]